jgi:16S rRNA (guanine527-N7)-methyltransferase
MRAEDCPLEVDVVTARACAPMTKLLGFAKPCLELGAKGVFLKGEDVQAELDEAHKTWRFSAEIVRSLSDSRGRIVRIERLARAR